MTELVQKWLRQADTAQRSTALNPLGWALATLSALLLGSFHVNAPFGMQVTLLVLICMLVTAYLGAYAFFAWTQPDALRSEKFTLTKFAIERGLKGDNLAGLYIPGDISPPQILPPNGESEGHH